MWISCYTVHVGASPHKHHTIIQETELGGHYQDHLKGSPPLIWPFGLRSFGFVSRNLWRFLTHLALLNDQACICIGHRSTTSINQETSFWVSHTVDGWNLAPPEMYETLWNPINNGINYQPQLVIAGFLNHQQYLHISCTLSLPWPRAQHQM